MTWIGNALLIFGLILTGGKRRVGWVCTFIGEALWIAAGVIERRPDIWSLCVVFAVLAALNWWRWGKDDGHDKCGECDRVAGGPSQEK